MPKLKQPFLFWPLLLLTVASGLVLADVTGLRYLAALALLAFLPGWVWLPIFLRRSLNNLERVTLAVGLSLALTIIGSMVAVYLPGPLTSGQLLITIDVIIIAGLIITVWQYRFQHLTPGTAFSPIFMALLLVLLLAAALRLPRLGYAEFHEDEAEALMLGVRLLQGEDYALFLHRKGPAQMLLPVAFWLLTGRTTEGLVRFPFALSSLLSVATLYFLGRRWFGSWAGIVAGLLWAINGYAIAFGRMVQYQALIFFWGPLAIFCLYLAWKDLEPRLHIPAAVLLAACLLAHFDALLLLPAAGYLGWQTWTGLQVKDTLMNDVPQRPRLQIRISAGAAVLLFLGLLAAFYIPFFRDPEFQNTAGYLTESRVRPGLLYNNLPLLLRLDADYSSHFYLPVLAAGIVAFAIWQTRRFAPGWRWGLIGLGLLLASTVWLPETWRAGLTSLAALPWLAALIIVWLSANSEIKAAWLMFGAGFVGYIFLVDDPRTHVYILYPGAILLAGHGWKQAGLGAKHVGEWWGGRLSLAPLVVVVTIGVLLTALTVIYEGFIFLSKESTLAHLRNRWGETAWAAVYDDLPETRSYFGYPKREGWKTIGALRAEGDFPGDFRSVNEDFIIPIWYNYGEPRSCYNTPAYFFVRSPGANISVPDPTYSEVARVQREGQTRLHIFSAREVTPAQLPVYALKDYEASFDRLATPKQFTQQAEPRVRLETRFGGAMRFVGYDLATSTVAPGETLYVNLYWQAMAPPGDHFRAFVHLTDGTTLWGQQDEEPACRLPTTIWRTGQRAIGQFRLLVSPDTPPGRYPLIIGLYQADTLERLPITAGAGQLGDDFLWLGDVEIVED